MAYKPYCKKIDRSMMEWGFTVPKNFIKEFEAGQPVEAGSSRIVNIVWDNKKYPVRLRNVGRKNYPAVHQILWNGNNNFLQKLRKTFIQSYIILKSQKEIFDVENKKVGGHFRTKESQEAILFSPIDSKTIKAEVFIKIENEWNALFRRLTEENVFGWMFAKDKEYLISRSTNWMKVQEFKKHVNAVNVIYYLVNTKKKFIYIGKANVLGQRVKPGRDHQGMPGDWDLFKYDIVRPEYSNILERIEDHTIRTIASILKNDKKYPSLNLEGYKIVNSNWKKL